MDLSIILEYGWVFLVLIGLEGILAADNAVVMAVMVKHLPEKLQKKALFYGLLGAFIFRFAALFAITFLVNVWQIQAIGAVYLIYLAIHHMVKNKNKEKTTKTVKNSKGQSFWMTVLKVEIADIAFAIDSMLAAVALAVTLKPTGWFQVGGIDGGQFTVMLLGGLVGVVIMRFAATSFVKLLAKYPTLETAAFLIVGWVGVKLSIFTLAHPNVSILDEHFPESTAWKLTFWIVLIGIALGGYLISKKKAIHKRQSANLYN
ncbi:TerC family protein [Bacillus sp. FJAT-49732]|uniref:TerC family protein n=1 Tax=Lederbergia citrisecunda TaxID=2833583 RepID=A0A942YKM5_9BACI|nr:TerC family protein [Lederbergia citrisecunda]MBS4198740.1 TerC family protein [Lederbergia citrisecunda]